MDLHQTNQVHVIPLEHVNDVALNSEMIGTAVEPLTWVESSQRRGNHLSPHERNLNGIDGITPNQVHLIYQEYALDVS